MKKMLLVITAAMATTACSPALYGIPHRRMPSPGYYGQPRAYVEQVPTGRWDNVMRLPRGSTIDVLTQDGAANVGPISGADINSVRLLIDGAEARIARADVVRVDLVDMAGSETVSVGRKAARGALLGAGFVALLTGVVGGDAWPPPGAALRAGAAIGGVSAGQAEVMRRAGRLIYLAPQQPGQAGVTTYR